MTTFTELPPYRYTCKTCGSTKGVYPAETGDHWVCIKCGSTDIIVAKRNERRTETEFVVLEHWPD